MANILYSEPTDKDTGCHNAEQLAIISFVSIIDLAKRIRRGEVKVEDAVIKIEGIADLAKCVLLTEPPFANGWARQKRRKAGDKRKKASKRRPAKLADKAIEQSIEIHGMAGNIMNLAKDQRDQHGDSEGRLLKIESWAREIQEIFDIEVLEDLGDLN